MFEYFYNEIFRSVIIAFGSIFNGIEIRKDSGNIRVPLAYGPTQKFLARMQQDADLNRPVQITLPRMSFEMNGLNYDPTRKMTQTQKFTMQAADGSAIKKAYLPVPYNMQFELSIMTKLNDDMLQITEQIIPRRALIYTFRFTAKTYVFGPITTVTDDIIKKVQVGYIAGKFDKSVTPTRDVTYSVTPRAVKDYDGSVATLLSANVNLTDDVLEVDDGTTLTKNTYIYIDEEEMYVEAITGNKINVKRAQDGSTLANHVLGAQVKTITSADADYIEVGDNFGFDGSLE